MPGTCRICYSLILTESRRLNPVMHFIVVRATVVPVDIGEELFIENPLKVAPAIDIEMLHAPEHVLDVIPRLQINFQGSIYKSYASIL